MQLVNRTPNRLAIAALAATAGDSVLELGFGPGDGLAALVRSGCKSVHGIDHSAAMLAQATRRNRQAVATGRVILRQGDFTRLPYADDSFDKVLAVNVAYFWRDARAVLGEIRRVLRPGGRLTIYVTDRATMEGWRFATTRTHRHFDAAALLDFAVDGGFDAEHVTIARSELAAGIGGLIANCDIGQG